MRTFTITPPDITSSAGVADAAQRLSTLLGISQKRCKSMMLEAPSTNGGTVYYGGRPPQNTLAASEKSDILPQPIIKDVWVGGDGSDQLIVTLFG